MPSRLISALTASDASPTTKIAADSQQSLSQVLDAGHNHPVFAGDDLHATISTRIDRLTIQLAPIQLDDLRNLWTALGTAMQQSVYYGVGAHPSALITARAGKGLPELQASSFAVWGEREARRERRVTP
jgi:Pvc16 N-terminal domain